MLHKNGIFTPDETPTEPDLEDEDAAASIINPFTPLADEGDHAASSSSDSSSDESELSPTEIRLRAKGVDVVHSTFDDDLPLFCLIKEAQLDKLEMYLDETVLRMFRAVSRGADISVVAGIVNFVVDHAKVLDKKIREQVPEW